MGCWYSTCYMSHLPLMPGDDIAIFILAPKRSDEYPGMTCYPNDRYEPIGFPIFAEYDDDTQLRNIREINDYTTRYLREFATVYTKTYDKDDWGHENPIFVEYEWSNIEDFIRNVVYGQLWVECDFDYKKRPLEHVMIHSGLYNKLLQNMSQRVPYGKTESYEDLMCRKVLKAIEWLKEENEWETTMKQKYDVDATCLRRFSDKVRVDSFSYWNSLDKMARYHLETEDYCILDEIVRYIMWATVMSYSRNGYHCISGGGSQSQEMMIQKIIAEFIIIKCTERELEAEKDREEYDDEDDGNVLEETLLFWDD